jgi:outer membrane protease
VGSLAYAATGPNGAGVTLYCAAAGYYVKAAGAVLFGGTYAFYVPSAGGARTCQANNPTTNACSCQAGYNPQEFATGQGWASTWAWVFYTGICWG